MFTNAYGMNFIDDKNMIVEKEITLRHKNIEKIVAEKIADIVFDKVEFE